ncbi:hypothetical protein GCM10009863_52730 [Streptomyces axinellae]|uniref:DUF5753 domain-containing protein n=1 Tax=Streptomyces axinellae TaxID=552788 RepID=A0ABN3QMW5_9ACTN
MPGPKDIDGSAGVPTFYGAELRWKREQAGLTRLELVEDSFYGASHLSEIEAASAACPATWPSTWTKSSTQTASSPACEDVRRARRKGHARYFEKALEAEGQALTIEEWSPSLFPGLLQTETYARAVVGATHPTEPPDEVAGKVEARMTRAQLLKNNLKTPTFWTVLHESLLRRPILSPAEMAASSRTSQTWHAGVASFHRFSRGTRGPTPS